MVQADLSHCVCVCEEQASDLQCCDSRNSPHKASCHIHYRLQSMSENKVNISGCV